MEPTSTAPEEPWSLEIRPEESLLHVDLGELWRYRSLFLTAISQCLLKRRENHDTP